MDRKTTRQKVLEILQLAMTEHLNGRSGMIYYQGVPIPCPDGFVPQWALATIHIVGSTEGKRRLRELRADPELQQKYVFEKKKIERNWHYRILPRGYFSQGKLAIA